MLILEHLKTLLHVSIIILIKQGIYELPENDQNNDRNMLGRF